MFLALLALLFIGLKLAGIITWSWFYVVLPILAGPIILLSFMALVALGAIGVSVSGSRTKVRRRSVGFRY